MCCGKRIDSRGVGEGIIQSAACKENVNKISESDRVEFDHVTRENIQSLTFSDTYVFKKRPGNIGGKARSEAFYDHPNEAIQRHYPS